MAADSVHGVIEKNMRACDEIITIDDMTVLIDGSSKKICLLSVKVDF